MSTCKGMKPLKVFIFSAYYLIFLFSILHTLQAIRVFVCVIRKSTIQKHIFHHFLLAEVSIATDLMEALTFLFRLEVCFNFFSLGPNTCPLRFLSWTLEHYRCWLTLREFCKMTYYPSQF